MRNRARSLGHPVVQIFIIATCVLLWMPFGIGYYEWPWRVTAARIGIQFAVFALLMVASIGVVTSLRPNIRKLRLFVSILAVLTASFGIFALYSWKDRHLDFLERRDEQNRKQRPNKSPEPTPTAVTPRATDPKPE